MKRLVAVAVLVVAAPVMGQEVQQQAKTITFPSFTVEQNWARAVSLLNANIVAGFGYAKSRGVSAEDYGHWLGKTFAPGWGQASVGTAIRYARGIQNNLRAYPGVKVEVLSAADTAVTMRTSRPYVTWFGTTSQLYGVNIAEYDTVISATTEEIAHYLGLRYQQRIDGDWLTMTISGRGKDAVTDFPRATFTIELTAQDPGVNPDLIGSSDVTFATNGHYTISHGGKPYLIADYDLSLDEVVFSKAPGVECSRPGRYRWTVNPVNGNLSFGRLLDDCAQRAAFFTRRAFTKK